MTPDHPFLDPKSTFGFNLYTIVFVEFFFLGGALMESAADSEFKVRG